MAMERERGRERERGGEEREEGEFHLQIVSFCRN